MGYLELMKAKRQAGKTPSLEARRWSRQQRERIEQGGCVKCGEKPLSANSYLCPDCESLDTLEDIREEIGAARRKANDG